MVASRDGDDVGPNVQQDGEEGGDPGGVDEGRLTDEAREDALGAGEGRLRVPRVDVARRVGQVELVSVVVPFGFARDLFRRRVPKGGREAVIRDRVSQVFRVQSVPEEMQVDLMLGATSGPERGASWWMARVAKRFPVELRECGLMVRVAGESRGLSRRVAGRWGARERRMRVGEEDRSETRAVQI